MNSIKAAAIISFLASQAFALPAGETTTTYACNPAHSYPNGQSCISSGTGLTLVTAAAASTTYACNPAHSYPNGQSCISSGTGLTLVTPTAASTTYACNPAHSYPNGQSCISSGTGLTLVSPAAATTAAASTTYACNPAHSYPNGASCVSSGTGLVLVTPTVAATPAATPSSASKCPLDLKAGSFEYPHLLEINGVNGYFGRVDRDSKTSFTFDIPASDAGKNCDTYFSLPAKGTMETSDYNLTTVDGAKIVVSEGTMGQVASFEPETNMSWLIYSEKCNAGEQLNYTMSTGDSVELSWFQDYNPCAVGMFVVVS